MSALHNITQKKPRIITHSARLNYGEWIGPSEVAHYHSATKRQPDTHLLWQSFSTREKESKCSYDGREMSIIYAEHTCTHALTGVQTADKEQDGALDGLWSCLNSKIFHNKIKRALILHSAINLTRPLVHKILLPMDRREIKHWNMCWESSFTFINPGRCQSDLQGI